MARIAPILYLFACAAALFAAEPQERLFESVLASLPSGSGCWSSVDLRNLGDRVVMVEMEAHRASGALVALVGHPQVMFHLHPGEQASYRLDVQDDSGDAWVKVREIVPSPRLYPVIAAAGTSECVVENQLRTTKREIAYPVRNPWFSGDVSEIAGDIVSVVNTSEQATKVSLCYSAGNLYSVPEAPMLTPVCSHAVEVQIPPFGARQFPVQHQGSSHFELKTKGDGIVLQMLRPLQTGVRVYTVDSTIKFGAEASIEK
ncbi:MAG TPA: hypothetical protein VEU96_14955 [Bryobacteraceae bacterium]|nr:hypothetical protein [Bryobacteraceae bacterium]